jgi:hypothetical protein
MDIHVRRIQLEPQTGRGDTSYLFFETGQIAKPLVVLNEYEMARMMAEAEEQTHPEPETIVEKLRWLLDETVILLARAGAVAADYDSARLGFALGHLSQARDDLKQALIVSGAQEARR